MNGNIGSATSSLTSLKVSEEEKKLILLIRKIGFGTLEKMLIKNGKPIRVEGVRQTIDFEKDSIEF